jgi:hypothetical protein
VENNAVTNDAVLFIVYVRICFTYVSLTGYKNIAELDPVWAFQQTEGAKSTSH